MTNFEKMCKEYRENKRMIEELTKMNDALKADILQYIGDNDVYIIKLRILSLLLSVLTQRS